MRYELLQASRLVEASSRIARHPELVKQLRATVNEDDVEAYLLNNGLLLLPGSDSLDDYIRYNFRLNVGGKRYSVRESRTGAALGARWHEGFLAYSLVIRDRLAKHKPKFIIGHSLGAAAAQVLSFLWRIPAIGFAAPRLYAGGRPVENSRLCLCLWRQDDPVGNLPGQFHHIGTSMRLDGTPANGLLNHSLKAYRDAVTHNRRVVPRAWPR